MQKITRTKYICIILSVLLLFSACSPTEAPADSGAAKGRYVEEVMALPDTLTQIWYLDQTSSGKLRLLGFKENEMGYWVWDDGQWTEPNPDWFSALMQGDIAWITAFTFNSIGVPYCTYMPESPELLEAMDTDNDFYMGDFPDPVFAKYVDGEWTSFPSADFGDRVDIDSMRILSNGNILIGYYDKLALYSPTGKFLADFATKDNISDGSYAAWGEDTLGLTNQGKLELYSQQDGTAKGEIAFQQTALDNAFEYATGRASQTVFCHDSYRDSVCYVNKSGIFQTFPETNLTEKLVDANLTSLIMPSVEIQQLFAMEDGSFLVLTAQDYDDYQMFRYAYDESVETIPGTQLRVYSLYDTPTIRQALGSFQRSNPGVMVKYEVGIPEDNGGVTMDDATRTLSTELLAGNGPDLLVLDYLPVESYIEKGVLAELQTPEGSLLESVLDTYRRDGKLYAVPTHYTLPLLLAEPGVAAKVGTPAELAAYLSTRKNPRIGRYLENMFYEMAVYYQPRWTTPEGEINRVALTEDLAAFKQIIDQLTPLPNPDGGSTGGDYIMNGLLWKDNSIDLYIGSLFALNNLRGPYTALLEREGALTLYPEGQNTFIPQAVLAVNAGSGNREIAEAFLLETLSTEQQSYELGDGLPINMDSFRAILESDVAGGPSGAWGYDVVDPETGQYTDDGMITQCYWPDEAFQNMMLDYANSLTTPLETDIALRDIIFGECGSYFSGARTLELTVDEIVQKAELRLAE
ncbi:MAG: hypothetical protein ACK5LX_16905 [Oscillospiraceae bacterium]